ncbi:MAG: methylated-DNA--[protein]-cysteine S-methyltransferase [Bermanella sp.]
MNIMIPTSTDQDVNYQRITKAIEYLVSTRENQPSLAKLASHVGLSEFHLQRLFSQWVGISPKQFVLFLTQQYAKTQLQKFSVLQSALNSGLSSAGRLHDLMIRCEGITPGEYNKQGSGLHIVFGVHQCPFALCLLATTQRGICKLVFFDKPEQADFYIDELHYEWPNAQIENDPLQTELLAKSIFDKTFNGFSQNNQPLNILLKGTDFQLQVWQALLSVPQGHLCSYQQVAELIGKPESVRAVASAIAKNKVGYLIPCHRVIKSNGDFNQYRWGSERKKAMIVLEQGRLLEKLV